MNKWLRKDLADFEPYIAHQIEHTHKVNANESPFGLDKNIKNDLLQWIENEELRIYPDTNCSELIEKLADFYSLKTNNFSVGVGSDGIIDYITKGFLDVGDKVVVPSPSFEMYGITTTINRGTTDTYYLDDNYDFDEDEVIAKGKDAKLVFICNPNNPTGTLYSKEKIIKIIENTDCPVIIDEAYGEFVEEDFSFINDIEKYKNIIVLKTFSKAFGLAGLRLGYAIAHRDLIEVIEIVKPPYNVSSVSQFLGVKAIENYENYKKEIDLIIKERNRFYEELALISFIKAFESHSNFIYLESEKDIYTPLIKEGILIRKFGDTNKYRITITVPEVNNRILNIIKGVE